MPGFRARLDETSPATSTSRRTFKLPWKRDQNSTFQLSEPLARVLGVFEKVMKLAADTCGDAGVPGLGAGLSGAAEGVRRLQAMSITVKGVDTLKTRIEQLSGELDRFDNLPRNQPMPEAMRSRLVALVQKWAEAGVNAHGIKKRHWMKRLWRSDADAAELQGLVDKINTSISEFMLQGGLVVEENVLHMRAEVAAISELLVKRGTDATAGAIKEIQKGVKTVDLEGLLLPLCAKKAQFNADDVRHGCLENTRVGLLERLRKWVLQPTSSVFWINGPAGTGKTTIAYSAAELSTDERILAASFFCSRSEAECSDANRIIPTVVYQLCRYNTMYKVAVEAVLQEDPNVVNLKLERQFEKLIVEPLEALKEQFPRGVVILDALDECQDKNATSIILTVLAKFVSRLEDYLVFLVTSRPEPHITVMFSETRKVSLAKATTLLLHEEDLDTVLEDIRRYFVQEFSEQAGNRVLPKDWPSTQNIDTLVKMSHGLFIWAVTAVLFIFGTPFSHPPEQFRVLTDTQKPFRSKTSMAHLESLYTQIAEAASSSIPEEYRDRFRLVLGTISVAQVPLSVDALAALLGIGDGGLVHNLLLGMHSVLRVPDDAMEPVRVIHPTFPEFLLASNVPKPDTFCIEALAQNSILFSRCLAVMADLKQGMTYPGDPILLKSEVPTLSEDVRRRISPHMCYACQYWNSHLLVATGLPELANTAGAFWDFLCHHLLCWLEVCSLLDILDTAVNALDAARRAFQLLGEPCVELVLLIVDCHRFLLKFIQCIDAAPLQVYHSAIAFAPSTSRVKQIYGAELRDSVDVCSGGMQDWGPCLDVFQGHAGHVVHCVEFSPDGTCFATGGEDCKIALRRSTTRTLLLSISGNHGGIHAIAFSPDGVHIASGSSDQTVVVWHLTSGDPVHTLEGHTGEVWSVTYSKDGNRVLSASHAEVILWDASDGHCVLTLNTAVADTWQAALSPDAGVIAHRDDSGLCLYNVTSGTSNTLSLSGPAHAATFSSDGRYIAAASKTSICIWTAADLGVVRSIDVHAIPLRLAFSHDGTRIACGSRDNGVWLWQVKSEQPFHVFRGHTESVYDVAWSPDDAQIASVSEDFDVRIWDPTRKPDSDVRRRPFEHTPPSPHSHPSTFLCRGDGIDIFRLPNLSDIETFQTSDGAPSLSLHSNIPDAWNVALSRAGPDRDLSMSWCTDSRDWELLTGQRHVRASWMPVIMSRDFSQMAYLPKGVNTNVHICSLRTGTVAAELVGHTKHVFAAAFSSDGALIVTGSQDNTVMVWNISGAALVASHSDHTSQVWDAAFSSDDRRVVSGSSDRTALVYDIAASRITHSFEHQAGVGMVAFSADDTHVLTFTQARNVSVWDLSQAACIYQVSIAGNTWPHSLDFTPDGSCILIRDPDGQALAPFAIQNPSERAWPMYHVSSDGWVTAVSPGRARRVCWLLPEWRIVFSLGGPRFCALDFDRKMSVVFDVSQTSAYAETWGAL